MSEEKHHHPGTGAEKRQHFRVNTELRIRVQAVGEGKVRPWAYASGGGVSPLVGPPEEERDTALEQVQLEPFRPVNLSAGGVRVGYRLEGEDERIPHVTGGDAVSALIELGFAGEPEFTLVHIPATAVWVDATMKWTYMAFQFGRIPSPVERSLSQFVMEVERRRLRGS